MIFKLPAVTRPVVEFLMKLLNFALEEFLVISDYSGLITVHAVVLNRKAVLRWRVRCFPATSTESLQKYNRACAVIFLADLLADNVIIY